MSDVREMTKAMLASGEVAVVVGYRQGRRPEAPAPHFARTAADADALVLNPYCRGGLAAYARRETAEKAASFVASKGDVRALKVLAQERQIDPERVRVIAFDCDAAGRATILEGTRLSDFGALGGDADAESLRAEIARLKAMAPAERWAYWRKEFDRCIRCYACRAACPLCYCKECIADRNIPQWIDSIARSRGNFAWNLIRAWHLAGRCTLCGACARACPEGIKIDLLNRAMADVIEEQFGYAAGEGSVEDAAFFATFKEGDSEEFITDK